MKNEIYELQEVINSSDDVIIVYVKANNCDELSENESKILELVKELKRNIQLKTLCFTKETVPFPEPHMNRFYFFLPKNQEPIMMGDGNFIINNFDNVFEHLDSRMNNITVDEIKIIKNPEKAKEMQEMLKKEDISKFPSTFQMARNVFKQAWDSTKGVLSGRNFLIDADTANNRYNICESCEFLKEKRCTHCGCFMETKVHLESSSCPIGKW